MQTNNPESGFNSDRTIRQYTHSLLLESPLVPSGTDCWAIRAKIRQKRPSQGKNGRLGGCSSETGSRNMAATQKMNSLTLVSYSLLQTLFGRPYYRSSLIVSSVVVCRRLSLCDVLYCGKTVRPSEKVSEGMNRKPGSKS